MTTIDRGPAAPGSEAPAVAVRLVSTTRAEGGDVTRRVDFVLGAEETTAVEDDATASFPTERLWPEVRDRLPDLALLRADPRARPAPERRTPGADFVDRAQAYVVLATLVSDGGSEQTEVAVRTWFVTDDELWSATAQPGGTTDLRPAAEGAVADLLVWDVTGAFEALLRAARP